MSDEIKNPQETQSPEHVSLEKRFGVESKKDGIEFEKEVGLENTAEKSVTEKDGSYNHILSKVQSQDDDNNDAVMQDASTLHQQTDRESQITHLIDLATTKGVSHAVKVAQKAEDYYVLDQLHDRLLADDLHDALVSNGMINK